jgi:hypothetical protein
VITRESWTGGTYWLAAHKLARERAVSVCVVGSGETAASVVVIDLLKRCSRHSTIDALATRGVLYSRARALGDSELRRHLGHDLSVDGLAPLHLPARSPRLHRHPRTSSLTTAASPARLR